MLRFDMSIYNAAMLANYVSDNKRNAGRPNVPSPNTLVRAMPKDAS